MESNLREIKSNISNDKTNLINSIKLLKSDLLNKDEEIIELNHKYIELDRINNKLQQKFEEYFRNDVKSKEIILANDKCIVDIKEDNYKKECLIKKLNEEIISQHAEKINLSHIVDSLKKEINYLNSEHKEKLSEHQLQIDNLYNDILKTENHKKEIIEEKNVHYEENIKLKN